MAYQTTPLTGQRVEKIIYNPITQSYWHIVAVDLGRPDRVEPDQDWQEYKPENPDLFTNGGRHKSSRKKMTAVAAAARHYLLENGPATLKEVSVNILWVWQGDPPARPHNSLYDLTGRIGAVRLHAKKGHGSGGMEYVWGLKGIHAP